MQPNEYVEHIKKIVWPDLEFRLINCLVPQHVVNWRKLVTDAFASAKVIGEESMNPQDEEESKEVPFSKKI